MDHRGIGPKKMCVLGYPTVPDLFMPKSADPECFITFIHENIHNFGKFMIFEIIQTVICVLETHVKQNVVKYGQVCIGHGYTIKYCRL